MQRPNVPNKPSNPIQDQLVADMKRRKESLEQAFSALEDGNVRSIPEAIFVRDFLPMFSGQPVPNKQELLKTWFLIAGTPYIPVNVVDANGNKIIQIPAVHDAAQLNPAPNSAEVSLGVVATEAEQASRQAPRFGDAVISRALAGRIHRVEAPREPSAGWQAVFAHYKVGAYAPAVAEAAKKVDPNESDFEMD